MSVILLKLANPPKVTATVLNAEWTEVRVEAEDGVVSFQCQSPAHGNRLAIEIADAVHRAAKDEAAA